MQAEARAIFSAETGPHDPALEAPTLKIDGLGVEEILQAKWRRLEDLTADQERQASEPPPIHPSPPPRAFAREGASSRRRTSRRRRPMLAPFQSTAQRARTRIGGRLPLRCASRHAPCRRMTTKRA